MKLNLGAIIREYERLQEQRRGAREALREANAGLARLGRTAARAWPDSRFVLHGNMAYFLDRERNTISVVPEAEIERLRRRR
jgi:hypothetical protein